MSARALAPTLAARIRAHRERLGLSLRRLDDTSGINFRRLWLLEQGAKATARELALLATAFEVAVGELDGDVR